MSFIRPGLIDTLSFTPDRGILKSLSQAEVRALCEASQNGIKELFRQCTIAVLNTGAHCDSIEDILGEYKDFRIEVNPASGGLRLDLHDIPYNEHAFIDGQLNQGTKGHIVAALRDLVFFQSEMQRTSNTDFQTPEGITNSVFSMLRNASLIETLRPKDLVIIWGGHSISGAEYDYTKRLGEEFGLRGMDIGTGCGPGAMKGPMKGAILGHHTQRITDGMYMGLTEPEIIAAEPPNPAVNELIIFPDIEKRLEGFIRRGHGITVVPGGVGTAEEIFELLGILLAPENKEIPFPVVLTGSEKIESSAGYFQMIDKVIGKLLGREAQQKYKIILDNPAEVAREMQRGMKNVRDFRAQSGDHENFNWNLTIPHEFQEPFWPTHENMSTLDLRTDQPKHIFAANLRKLFSGIVKGNITPKVRKEIAEKGPFKIHAPQEVMELIDEMLQAFIAKGRMKISGEYTPCYELVK